MRYIITTKLHVFCLMLAFLTYIPFHGFMSGAVEEMFESQAINYPTPYGILNFIIISMVSVSLTIILHEYIHKFFYERFGGKAVIGFKLIYAYTQEISKIAIDAWKFIIILLAPLVIISVCTLPINHWVPKQIFYFNFVGATGDMIMSLIVLKYGRKGKIIDENNGFSIV